MFKEIYLCSDLVNILPIKVPGLGDLIFAVATSSFTRLILLWVSHQYKSIVCNFFFLSVFLDTNNTRPNKFHFNNPTKCNIREIPLNNSYCYSCACLTEYWTILLHDNIWQLLYNIMCLSTSIRCTSDLLDHQEFWPRPTLINKLRDEAYLFVIVYILIFYNFENVC